MYKKIVIGLLCLSLISLVGCSSSNTESSKAKTSNTKSTTETKSEAGKGYIKNLGVTFGAYDPATKKAGDFDFAAGTPQFNHIFMDYGFTVPGTEDHPAKTNPQPTMYLPLGTKVTSLVDGIVQSVPKLYSNDYSVMVQVEGSDLIFETEHVINPQVKKGDKVKAGQVIAEVSDYDTHNTPGLGLFEIGVLQGGNPPNHLCPTDYFHSSVKAELEKQITDLQKAWETYTGNSDIYDESNTDLPGCITKDPIDG